MAYCSNCGKEISPAAAACPNCGHPGGGARAVIPSGPSHPYEGLAIASLACAVAGFFVIPLIGSILGIIFGGMAKRRLAENPQLEGETLARAGVIVGWVGVGLAALIVGLIILGIALSAGSEVIHVQPNQWGRSATIF